MDPNLEAIPRRTWQPPGQDSALETTTAACETTFVGRKARCRDLELRPSHPKPRFNPITARSGRRSTAASGDEINVIEKGKNYGWPVIRLRRELHAGTGFTANLTRKAWAAEGVLRAVDRQFGLDDLQRRQVPNWKGTRSPR